MFGHLLKKTAVSAPLMLAVLLSATANTPITGQTVQPKPKPKANVKATVKAAAKTPVDLNKATAEEMVAVLPGVGEATAKKIVAGRPYTSVNDLARAGVPARTIEAIRPMVTIAAAPAAKAKTATKKDTAPAAIAKVNINTASAEELQTLPGIGPAHAHEIVALRPFKSVDDLDRVKGLGKARIDAIRNHVVLTATAPPVVAAPAPNAAMPKAAVTTTKAAVTTTKAAAKTAAGRLAPGQIVNINTASKEELDALPGIGPVKSQAILDARPFATKEDIMKVKGIKEGEFSKIKDMITVK
jgi:competence protein ComEA